jgi:hypothetical protein
LVGGPAPALKEPAAGITPRVEFETASATKSCSPDTRFGIASLGAGLQKLPEITGSEIRMKMSGIRTAVRTRNMPLKRVASRQTDARGSLRHGYYLPVATLRVATMIKSTAFGNGSLDD